MNSHEVDYEILGDDMQMVEVELDPGCRCERGEPAWRNPLQK